MSISFAALSICGRVRRYRCCIRHAAGDICSRHVTSSGPRRKYTFRPVPGGAAMKGHAVGLRVAGGYPAFCPGTAFPVE